MPENVIIEKPWGYEEILYKDSYGNTVKRIGIAPKAKLSLQLHTNKVETSFWCEGDISIQIGDDTFIMQKGKPYHITPMVVHRLINNANYFGIVIEISNGQDFDIIRLRDDHGRSDLKVPHFGQQQ